MTSKRACCVASMVAAILSTAMFLTALLIRQRVMFVSSFHGQSFVIMHPAVEFLFDLAIRATVVLSGADHDVVSPGSSLSSGLGSSLSSGLGSGASSGLSSSASSSSGGSSASVVPTVVYPWIEINGCPAAMGQNDTLRGESSACWFMEWLPAYAAYLQTNTRGTPRMQGNWSKSISDKMLAFQQNIGMGSTCDNNPLIYPITAFTSLKPQFSQDAIGGTTSILFYVDVVNGNDQAGTGDIGNPYASLAHAVSATRRIPINPNQPTKTIVVRQGVYRFTDPLILNASDQNLAIVGFHAEDVVFTGSAAFSPSWSLFKPNVYMASLPSALKSDWQSLNEMFVDGNRQTRARWPNGNSSSNVVQDGSWSSAFQWSGTTPFVAATETTVNGARSTNYFQNFQMGYNGSAAIYDPPQNYWAIQNPTGGAAATHLLPTGFTYNAALFSPNVASWTNLDRSYVHVVHCQGWGSWQFALASISTGASSVTLGPGGWQEARGCSTNDCTQCPSSYRYMFVDHQLAELDQPGEFYVDATSRLLYYYPLGGTPPSVVEVTQTPTILRVENAVNVTIQGVTFMQTSNSFMSLHAANGGGDWANTKVAAVQIDGCRNCSISNNMFINLGGNGVGVNGASNGTFIAYNEMSYTGANSIAVMGDMIGYDGQQEWRQPRDTLIRSNRLSNAGIYNKQSGFVFISYAYRTVVDGNVMSTAPRSGVNVQDGFGGGHVLSRNLIVDTSRETYDVGPFNSWNRLPYRTWNAQQNQYSFDTSSSYIHHNLLLSDNYGSQSNTALDHDDGSNNWIDYNNVLLYGRVKAFLGTNIQYNTNLWIPNSGSSCAVYGQPDGTLQFYNNTCLQIGYTSDYQFGTVTYGGLNSPSDVQRYAYTANNTYLVKLAVLTNAMYTIFANNPASFASFQSIGANNPSSYGLHTEQGSSLGAIPVLYPYYRFMGLPWLGVPADPCNLYSTPAVFVSKILASAAVSSGYTDFRNRTWSSLVCSDACSSASNGAAPNNSPDPLLYSKLQYNNKNLSYVFPIKNGAYSVTLMMFDVGASYNIRAMNASINGVQLMSQFDPDPDPALQYAASNVRLGPVNVQNNVLNLNLNGVNAFLSAVKVDALPSVTPPTQLFFVGDSITFGTATTYGFSYPQQVLTRLNNTAFTAIQFGVPTQTTRGYINNQLQSMINAINIQKYQHVVFVVFFGANDLLTSSSSQFQSDLIQMHSSIKAAGARTIAVPVLNRADSVGFDSKRLASNSYILSNYFAFADELADLTRQPQVYLSAAVSDPNFIAANDPDGLTGVHPTNRGAACIAEEVAQAVSRLLGFTLPPIGNTSQFGSQPPNPGVSSAGTGNGAGSPLDTAASPQPPMPYQSSSTASSGSPA